MSKKQLTTYKFDPGPIPPAFNQFPRTVSLVTANKNYIVAEATEFLSWKFNTPETAPANASTVENEVSLLLDNKDFIAQEANAWTLAQITNIVNPFVGYDYTEVKQNKIKRDIKSLVDAFAEDLAGGGNTETIRISRSALYLNGEDQLLSPDQDAAVYGFVKTLIADFVLARVAYSTDQDSVLAVQDLGSEIPVSDPADLAVSVANLNQLNDIVIVLITDGLDSLPALSYNYDAVFADLVYNENYAYDEQKGIIDTKYIIDALIYDLTVGGNSLTFYIASQYQVLGEYTVVNPIVERTIQTFTKQLISQFVLINLYHPSYQLQISQALLANAAEAAGNTQSQNLIDIVLNVLESGISSLPAVIVPNRQSGTLMPNAVSLLDRNKRYIMEETVAFVEFNVANNIFPFVFFNYNFLVGRQNISLVIEGYIKDFKNGGNVQTVFNAGQYWENGVSQIAGDRLPEVFTQRFIRDIIENFIWTNVPFGSRQIAVSQIFDNANLPEIFANTRLRELSNTITQVIESGLDFLPARVSNRGSIKIPGYFILQNILLITNTSRNQIIYNFADDTIGAEVVYSELFDPDFAGALFGVDKISTIILDSDTTGMSISDDIQIFVESENQTVRLNPIATDAMERMKVGIPQSMLDADFEYGLQPTKWQAIAQMRNYPSIFEIPGSDINVTSITTDASDGTGGTGASLITVNTVSAHGLDINTPITLKALSNSVRGFSRAEGSFLVADIIGPNQFTFYAKARVGTTPGEVLASTTTQLRRGGFYTGSSIGNPSFSVFSSGSSGNITTALITNQGSTTIGFVGQTPPIGAPLVWTGAGDVIASGTQITSVVGSGGTVASTTLAVKGTVGTTNITVTNNAGISTGLLVNRGDDVGISVTNVVGNNISLSGALTSDILGNTASYSGLAGINNSPTTGAGASFTVSRNGEIYSATATSPGTGYVVGNTITVLGSSLEGSSPNNDALLTVTAATNINLVSALDNSSLIGGSGYSTASNLTTTGGTGTGLTVDVTAPDGIVTAVAINNSGANYSIGDLITIDHPLGIGAVLVFSALLPSGTEYVSANNVATAGGTGTGLTVNVTASNGEITALTVNNPGIGYTTNNLITVIGGADRGAVTDIALLSNGDNYDQVLNQNLATIGGTGAGLTVDVNIASDGEVTDTALTSGGSNYEDGDFLETTVVGEIAIGVGLQVNVVTILGVVTEVVIQESGENYNVNDEVIILQDGSDNNAVLTISQIANGRVVEIVVSNPGVDYTQGDIISILGGDPNATFELVSVTEYDGVFTVTGVATSSTVDVLSTAPGGAIQTVGAAGTPIIAPSVAFVSAFTISDSTLAIINSGNQELQYSAIATIQSVFATPHGLVPGDTITVAITSNGENAQFAAGPYFVESVPTPTSLRYTARAAGTIENTLVGQIFGRPDSFFIHRPLDGGVQLGTAGPSHGASAVRMSKKYIRYQSGKGVMYNTGALFAPSYDIRSLTSTSTAIGSVITITTDDTDHGCQVGGGITVKGAITVGYNGEYTVASVINERVLTVVAGRTLGSTDAEIGNPCELSIRRWHGSTIRAGIYDDQNGMFWQYDGIRMAVVKRSATFQLAGTIAIEQNSNLIVGDNTRFRSQLGAGDKIVIRGMTHTVTSVMSDTQCTVTPDWRGVVDVAGVKASKVQDLQFPQEQWNIDTLDGKGTSGYNLDVTYMQMIGIQHTWYGAGFVDWMLRGSDGNYAFAHRLRNSNVNTEAYMRTGNQPVRYEVTNEGAVSKLSEIIDEFQDFIPLEDAYWFPDSGTVYVGNELISFTGKTNTALTGCTRSAAMTQFTAGSQRSFTAGPASSHTEKTGVVLVSNTITPNISHWGSAFLIDGQFDDDRGYIFNYAATGISATLDKTTAFLIRLSPSVSNAVIGDLGEKELLNRAQLLLNEISITSDVGTGAIVIEGVLNPINYPEDPTAITWQGLNTQAQGGQPSFAQVAAGGSVTWGAAVATSTATVQGAFSTTLTATSFDVVSSDITARGFNTVTGTLTAVSTSNRRRAFIEGSNTFLVSTAELDALTTSISQASQGTIGDLLANAHLISGQRINSIQRDVTTAGGVLLSRVNMTSGANSSSTQQGPNGNFQANVGVNLTFQISITYAAALNAARNDFLIAKSQFNTVTLATSDVASAANFITGGQSISSITEDFAKISEVDYVRIQLSATANGTTTPGTGNDVTVTVSAAATILYGQAISTSRQDFLIPQSQLTGSGILVGDRVNAATVLVDNQAVQQIISNFITINSIVYGRIVMSANGSANSASGAGNNVAVTVTASGSANSYSGNFVFFTGASFIASGATVGTRISTDYTQFPAGTAIASVSTRTFDGISVFRVTFSQSTSTPIAAVSTIEFQFGAEYALPGETVFSFIANPGETATLRLQDLKELTSSAIGGRGTFPNGPDVLAINIYKIAGVPVPSSVILRWGEAQA